MNIVQCKSTRSSLGTYSFKFYFAPDRHRKPGSNHDGDGFVIITAVSDQGVAYIHDRKPLGLTHEHARKGLDPGLAPKRAEEIARERCQPIEDFEWYAFGKEAGT